MSILVAQAADRLREDARIAQGSDLFGNFKLLPKDRRSFKLIEQPSRQVEPLS
jgi:hypothetical protein